jgi:hypothetical protein
LAGRYAAVVHSPDTQDRECHQSPLVSAVDHQQHALRIFQLRRILSFFGVLCQQFFRPSVVVLVKIILLAEFQTGIDVLRINLENPF